MLHVTLTKMPSFFLAKKERTMPRESDVGVRDVHLFIVWPSMDFAQSSVGSTNDDGRPRLLSLEVFRPRVFVIGT